MTSRYEAYMDDIALSSIDPSICVLDIEPTGGEINTSFSNVANRDGARVSKRKKVSTGVKITLEIHEYDIIKRQDICQRVNKWANGKMLKVNDRQDQRLRCICDQYATISAKKWTEPITLVFTAYTLPYWEEENPSTVTVTGTDEEGQVYVPGNAGECLVEASVKANATVTSFTLTVGKTSITLSELSMATNDVVNIAYDENLIQSIKKGNTSLLDKRTGSDDLLAPSGEFTTVSIEASGSISATFSVRGCWQ